MQRLDLLHLLPSSVILARPVDAVFIGISNFERPADRIPTPAHSIGAALVYSMFFSADRNAAKFTPYSTSNFTFRSELKLNPTDPTWNAKGVYIVLKNLPGVDVLVGDYSDVFANDLDENRLWSYLTPEALTRSEVIKLLRAQRARLNDATAGIRRLGVFYLMTHGAVGPDGQRYAMAADSVGSDLSTWMKYQDLLEILRPREDDSTTLSMLVFIDTCLVDASSVAPMSDLDIPPGMIVVTAAAPGQYSWRWNNRNDVQQISRTVAVGPWKHKLSAKDLSFYSSLSILPVASAMGLKQEEVKIAETCGNTHEGQAVAVDPLHYAMLVTEVIDEPQNWGLVAESSVAPKQTAALHINPDTVGRIQSMKTETDTLFAIKCPSSGTARQ